MTEPVTESVVEEAALAWPEDLGYVVLAGPEITPGGFRIPDAERIVGGAA